MSRRASSRQKAKDHAHKKERLIKKSYYRGTTDSFSVILVDRCLDQLDLTWAEFARRVDVALGFSQEDFTIVDPKPRTASMVNRVYHGKKSLPEDQVIAWAIALEVPKKWELKFVRIVVLANAARDYERRMDDSKSHKERLLHVVRAALEEASEDWLQNAPRIRARARKPNLTLQEPFRGQK